MAKKLIDPEKPMKVADGKAIVKSTLKVGKDKTIEGGTLKEVEVKGNRPKAKVEQKVSYGAFTEKSPAGTASRPKMSKSDYDTVKKRLLVGEGESDEIAQSKIKENMDLVKRILKEKSK